MLLLSAARLPAQAAGTRYEPLIDTIKQEAPDFFTAAEEDFERDLARTASFGFCYRSAWGLTVAEQEPGSGTERLARSTKVLADL